jgi:hypothetical protein
MSLQLNVIPGFSFPTVGRLGLTSPPSRPAATPPDHRYYDPLILPTALLGFLATSYRPPIPCMPPLFCVFRKWTRSLPRKLTTSARTFDLPVALIFWVSLHKETVAWDRNAARAACKYRVSDTHPFGMCGGFIVPPWLTFPAPSLKFRTSGFPQYGSKDR